jgi:hypothetical protein
LVADQTFTLKVYAPFPAPAGLVDWWRAEINALDSAGTNNGVLVNTTFTPGKVGWAFNLNGTNAWVQIPNSSWLNPTGAFSVELWLNANSQQFYLPFLLVDKSHGFADSTGWAMQGNNDGTVSFFFGQGGGGANNFIGVPTLISLLDNCWHRLVGVYTGTQILLYEDGVFQNMLNTSSLPVGNTRDVEIGRSWGGGFPTRFFRGLLDEVSYYNRALSTSEVSGLYAASLAGKTASLPPIVLTASLQNGLLVLAFGATPGRTYAVLYRDSLSSGSWQPLTNIVADSAIVSYTNTVAAPQQRFFRVSTAGN